MNQRLEQFLAAENITQAAFADKIKVARASVSHILSGRNKPGYDFFASLIRNYPSLNIEWLITGKGKMYKASVRDQVSDTADIARENISDRDDSLDFGLFGNPVQDTGKYPADTEPQPDAERSGGMPASAESSSTPADASTGQPRQAGPGRKAVKVIVFYDNGTFDEFSG